MATASGGEGSKLTAQQNQQIIEHFKRMTAERQGLGKKLVELQQDAREHALVLETLQPLDRKRKAWRKVGGVLVERDVERCEADVAKNLQLLGRLIEDVSKQLEAKEAECEEFQIRFQLSINGMPPPQRRTAPRDADQ